MQELAGLIQYDAQQIADEIHAQIDGLEEVEPVDLSFYDVKTKVSDSDIVPEEFQNALMQISGTLTANYFAIGDIAEILIQRSAVNHLPISARRIYQAVGKFCGKAERTVRYYHETARHFPTERREEYGALPFSHFVFARASDEYCDAILQYALGKPWCSVAELALYRRGLIQNANNRGQNTDNALKPVVGLPTAENTPVKPPSAARPTLPPMSLYITRISTAIENLEALARSHEVSEPTRSKLMGYADAIRGLLETIQGEVQDYRKSKGVV